jgi:hypothetical protein
MKTNAKTSPIAAAPAPPPPSAVRFWACFFLCMFILAVIAGLMLAGVFTLMGYHVL